MAETANSNTTMLEFQTIHFHCKKKSKTFRNKQ